MLFVLSFVAAAAAIADAGPDAASLSPATDTVTVRGRALDTTGRPVAMLRVLATVRNSGTLRAETRTGPDGAFSFQLRREIHDFTIMSSRWLMTSFAARDDASVEIRVRLLFPESNPVSLAARATTSATVLVAPPGTEATRGVATTEPSVGVLRGRVVDPTGAPLPGIRLLALHAKTSTLLSATESGEGGRFALVTMAGANQIVFHAAGLTLESVRRLPRGEIEAEMAIDGMPASVTIYSGNVIRFDMNDSIWPEYVPPPVVRHVLKMHYQIDPTSFCPGDLRHSVMGEHWESKLKGPGMPAVPGFGPSVAGVSAAGRPLSGWQRKCRLPKFWWLRVLRETPPNPASQGFSIRPEWWLEVIADMQKAEDPLPKPDEKRKPTP